ncbi:histidine phosphatase family protein [Kutzneria chonburiensis]|uniref:Histidine phosphatase family protein n=1 Tax=Kutzneria chonburiensis TaxID=1483604 RepID=A0ABV6MRM5_9PSEU|nr:histidine phosphatase family protein [Kutzneria chonburiensis]
MTVHLVRHGETSSYDSDAGLTPRGVAQAETWATAFAAELDGAHVAFGYAPTARAYETALAIQRIVRPHGRCVELAAFRNLQVLVDGMEFEPTQVRQRAMTEDRGWAVEARRFWQAHERGDAMRFWLTTPLLWHESPAAVVRRFLTAVIDHDESDHLVVATHSGCLRAIVAWAKGSDPGEPDNAESVSLRRTGDHVEIRCRGEEFRCELPS